MGAKIVGLGRKAVNFGRSGDVNRVRDLLTCEHWFDMAAHPICFTDRGEEIRHGRGIGDWPEGPQEVDLFAVCFDTNLVFGDLGQFMARLPEGYKDLQRTNLPHLTSLLNQESLDWLLTNEITELVLTDQASLWRGNRGGIYLPFMTIKPEVENCVIDLHNPNVYLPKSTFFLFWR